MKAREWFLKRMFVMMGVMDAALISGSGFLVNLLSGRYLSIEHYGLFVTFYTIATLSLIFQSSLISNPYMVLSQSVEGEQAKSYFCGTLIMTCLMGVVLGGLSMFLALLYLPAGINSLPFSLSILGAFFTYVLLNLIQDFLRRHYYSQKQELNALFLDLISYGAQVAVILALGSRLTLALLFWTLGGTTLLALLLSLMLNAREMLTLISHQEGSVRETIIRNWQFGRWILLSNGVSWVGNQFFVLALGFFQPTEVVAQLGVARTIAAASNPLVMAYESMGMPRLVNIWNQQGKAATRQLVVLTAFWGSLFFALLGSIFFFFPLEAVSLIFGKSFGDISLLVRVFAILPVLWFVGKVFSLAILAIRQPKALFPVYLIACVFTITGGLWMTYQYGSLGAGAGFLINGIILTAGFAYQFFCRVDSEPDSDVV